MKKLINNPANVVKEALKGVALVHGDQVAVHFDPDFIARVESPIPGKVAIVSGGGSGHEPMHGGFVGYGMLDAACPGAVFTSPTPDHRCWQPPKPWMAAPACCTLSKTTLATF